MTSFLLVWVLFFGTVGAYTPTTGDLIRGYCNLVKEYDFYKTFKLDNMCELYVKQFKDKVRKRFIKKTFLIQFDQNVTNLTKILIQLD